MSFTELLENVLDLKMAEIEIGMIGKIEKYDSSTIRADVQPLMKMKNALDGAINFPILIDLPVRFYHGGGFFIKPNYQAGDLVWVGFSTHDFADALKGYSRTASEAIFEINNACVMGGIVPDFFIPGIAFLVDGLVMGKPDGVAEPVIKGLTFLTALNSFLSALAGITPGSEAQNAAALTAIKTAAGTLQGQLESSKSTDVKIT